MFRLPRPSAFGSSWALFRSAVRPVRSPSCTRNWWTERRWLSDKRFLHALNYCMLLPGPEAQQLAIYIGWLMHRTWGGIVAGAFFVIPSVFILLGLSYIYAAFGNVPFVAAVLSGFKPIVVAIVVEAVIKIGGKALRVWAHFVIAGFAFASIYFLNVPFPLIVLAAAVIGLLGAHSMPAVFAVRPATPKADATSEGHVDAVLPLVIDDNAPQLSHTLPNTLRTLKILRRYYHALAPAVSSCRSLARLGQPARAGI